ncbi:hypothetical protein D9619_010436 [Psilocybe cf. subviscida]|uniref:Cerato-platanin n=1 Tax=Psilocybe cf. subviscida TaxID=2480587 RepID=A0A8H5ATF3_9AGAR|nr:hypothetical protein D9619_010436 [Psilocybe cf. subviscida]
MKLLALSTCKTLSLSHTHNMKFFSTLAPLATLVALTQAVSTTYDTVYDKKSQSLNTVACSTGSNGLVTAGFTTFGSLPTFPNIGGAPAITGFNDPDCGSCWNLTFTNSKGAKKSIVITAIDVSTPDFNIGLKAMNTLTGNQAEQLGRAPITAKRLAPSACGL